jgi:hypothetical protein
MIQKISLVKQGQVFSRDYDQCEWPTVYDFLREDMRLGSLNLTVEGGRPRLGWDNMPVYSAADYKTMSSIKYEGLEWVWQLLSIKGIRNLEISSEIHFCPGTFDRYGILRRLLADNRDWICGGQSWLWGLKTGRGITFIIPNYKGF